MNKQLKIIILLIIFFIHLTIIFSGIISRERILKNGKEYKFRVKPIDPYDAFRGRYVTLNFDETLTISEKSKFQKNQIVYALLKTDGKFTIIDRIVAERPKGQDYIETRITYIYKNSVRLKLPFDRYYLDENYAKKAENALREVRRQWKNENEKAYIKVKIDNGKAIIEDLCIGDKNIIEFIKEREKE